MKLNIADLLDDYREEGLITEEPTPLSLDRIRQRTMDVVAPRKKHPLRRTLPGLLAAALIISMLSITALAGERALTVSDWFRPALNQSPQEDAAFAQDLELDGLWPSTITGGRLSAIEEHGKIINQSLTQNGTTITLAALYGDEYILNLYFRVEAPEGTVLPDGLDYAFGNGVHLTLSGAPHGVVLVPEGYAISENYLLDLKALPDEDPTDNRKDFLLELHHGQYEQRRNGVLQKQWTFSDQVSKTFTIAGLYHELDNGSFETILTGDFSFDITNAHEVARREIAVTSCTYSLSWDSFCCTIEPVSLTLSPFTAVVESRTISSAQDHSIPMEFRIVLKDGTTERHWKQISLDNEPGFSREVMVFTNPIDLAQIDHILVGDPDYGDIIHKVPAHG